MSTVAPVWLWLVFVAIVLASLFVDFVVLKKQGAHEIGVKEALNWSLIWIALSFLFNGLFWWAIKDTTGSLELANTKSLEFLTGYLIEKSLAVDNIFVFLMIFTYIVTQCKLKDLFAQAKLANDFTTPHIRKTKQGYCLQTLQSSLDYLLDISKEDL